MSTNQPKETWSSCKCGAEREGTPQDNEQAICPDCNRTGCYVLAYDCDLSPTCKCEDCTKEHEPTPGAMRAAERIVKTVINNFNQFPTKEHKSEAINLVATLIDQETAAERDRLKENFTKVADNAFRLQAINAELLEVLREFVKQAEHKKRCCGSYGHFEDVTIKGNTAIAKAQGVQDVKD